MTASSNWHERVHFGLLISGLVSMFITPAIARPVSYQGGWTVIEETNRQSTSLWIHYTLTPKFSLGVRSEWDRREDYLFNGLQLTWLAKRWFGENFQANIYGTGGIGAITDIGEGVTRTSSVALTPQNQDFRQTNVAGFIGALADWETRRLFTSYQVRYLDSGLDTAPLDGPVDNSASFFQSARIGIAPYIGNTGDLHSWIMVEVDHRPNNDNQIGVTPLLRLFKGGSLLELGWSITDDQPLVNFTHRF